MLQDQSAHYEPAFRADLEGSFSTSPLAGPAELLDPVLLITNKQCVVMLITHTHTQTHTHTHIHTQQSCSLHTNMLERSAGE